ncbi:MAG TPA: hypothetical protein VK034_24160 [Enhygromyxa sp.]|nr:hypothetical protein [Enhygromyxa sp.]
MPTSDEPRALLGARIAGLLILAFALIGLADHLLFVWLRAVLDGGLELGSKHVHEVLELLSPIHAAMWVLEALAWLVGMLLIARAPSPARPAAIATAILAAIEAVATARFLSMVTPTSDPGAIDRLEIWADIVSLSDVLVWLGGIVTVLLLSRGRAQARPIQLLAALAALGPLLLAVSLADPELLEPLRQGALHWTALLSLASQVALGIAFVWASAGLDERSLDLASARSLELARALVWIRAGLVVVSVIASAAALQAVQRSRMSSPFDTPSSAADHERVVSLAASLGLLEAALGVGLALALALIGLQHRARERLLGAAGGLILFGLGIIGAGLALAQHQALLEPDSYFHSPLLDHLQRVQAIDPYLRGASVLGIVLLVVALMRVADRTGVAGEVQLRGVRFITIVGAASLLWIFAREGLASLGVGLWVVAVLGLAAAVMALIDLSVLLRRAAAALRGETPDTEDDPQSLD